MGGEELYQEGEREPSDKRADESKLPEEFGHDLDSWAHCFAQVICCRPTVRLVLRRGSQRYLYCNSLRRPSRGRLSSCRPVASSGQTAPGHEAVLPRHRPT